MTISVIEVAIHIVSAMGCDKDAPTPHDYGVLVSNLIMIRTNCPSTLWNEELWGYLAMPEDTPPAKYEFLTRTLHTQLLTKKLDELYEKHC
jgi:hypothetical protein